MRRGLDGYFYSEALCGFQGSPRTGLARSPVANSEGETPLPIPNRAVKPFSADGTWRATARESRSPPVLDSQAAPRGCPFLCAGAGFVAHAWGIGSAHDRSD